MFRTAYKWSQLAILSSYNEQFSTTILHSCLQCATARDWTPVHWTPTRFSWFALRDTTLLLYDLGPMKCTSLLQHSSIARMAMMLGKFCSIVWMTPSSCCLFPIFLCSSGNPISKHRMFSHRSLSLLFDLISIEQMGPVHPKKPWSPSVCNTVCLSCSSRKSSTKSPCWGFSNV
jgi:hypothetical protein